MLLLASKSPRRQELLKLLDIPFKLCNLKEVDEVYPESLKKEDIPSYLSKVKAKSYISELNDDDILITADTVVILNDEIIGKPKDLEEAKRMLAKLSGKTHKVVTGVTLTSIKKSVTFSEVTEVTFSRLSDEEINYYVNKYEPLDKAGAYGIQEWIGGVGVASVKGSFYNVMGLPIRRLYENLSVF